MTPDGAAIKAMRLAQNLTLQGLADRTELSRGYLSRLERGLTRGSDDTIQRLARALAVSPDDITRGDDVPDIAEKPDVARMVPYPGTPEGRYFHYTPAEAARFLPWSAIALRRKAYAREIPFNDGAAKITFTGRDICEISDMTAVRPLTDGAGPTAARSA